LQEPRHCSLSIIDDLWFPSSAFNAKHLHKIKITRSLLSKYRYSSLSFSRYEVESNLWLGIHKISLSLFLSRDLCFNLREWQSAVPISNICYQFYKVVPISQSQMLKHLPILTIKSFHAKGEKMVQLLTPAKPKSCTGK
jgi:hypothetical protein